MLQGIKETWHGLRAQLQTETHLAVPISDDHGNGKKKKKKKMINKMKGFLTVIKPLLKETWHELRARLHNEIVDSTGPNADGAFVKKDSHSQFAYPQRLKKQNVQ